MSWHGQGGGGPGDGVNNSGPAGIHGNQNMGTDYTLQGVMRFLQTEWHRHERERNQWEIERAEMRARIAKLEGENSAAKRLQQGYLKRVKMLEVMLKQERSKNEQAKVNGAPSEDKDQKKDAERPDALRTNSLVDVSSIPLRSESARQKSRKYLDDCLKEITYLLLPPNHPPPPANLPDPLVSSIIPQDQPLSIQQQQQISQQQRFPDNHPRGAEGNRPLQIAHTSIMQHQALNNQQPNNSLPFSQSHENRQQVHPDQQKQLENQNPFGGSNLENSGHVEKVNHRFNSFGEPIDASGENLSRISQGSEYDHDTSSKTDSDALDDAWDFEDVSKPSSGISEGLAKSPGQARRDSSSRRKSITRRRLSQEIAGSPKPDPGTQFKVRFALRGHLDVIRAITFTGGGSNMEPEICTGGDDGVIKRWTIPGGYLGAGATDVDVTCNFTHRGHVGMVTSLASSHSSSLSGGLSNDGEGWLFSGGIDATVKVWQKGQVDARATLVGHTDAVWAVAVLPTSRMDDRLTIVSGSADGSVKVWAVPPPVKTAHNSIRSTQSSFLSSQPTGKDEFQYELLMTTTIASLASPTCITPLSPAGDTFIVSFNDANILIYDTNTLDVLAGMTSLESYDGTPATGVNAVVATTLGLNDLDPKDGIEEEAVGGGATGGVKGGVAGVVIAGTEDRYVRFYDANSGQCTYNMLAHPAAISSLALQTELKTLVSAGHDGSLRFWDLEKRACTQEITSHRLMRGEGVCVVVWSPDGRWVVSGGGDGVVKVYAR